MISFRSLAMSLSAVLWLLPACGSDLAGLCDDWCSCEGCSDREYDNCVEDADDTERKADREGCNAELGDYAACLADNSSCHGNDFKIDHGDCRHEADDLHDCIN